MKKRTIFFLLAFFFLFYCAVSAQTVVFTGNIDISPTNTNYDGENVIISNCTVTVDGAHTFASLVITSNGVLTHSFSPGGQFTNTVNVTNEQQTLNGTTPVTLDNAHIFSPILVTDLGQTVVYTNGIDYDETNLLGGVVEIARTPTSSIPDGATVLVDYSWEYNVEEGLDLTVTGAVSVAAGSSINVNAIGYGGGLGQGAGGSSGGTYFDGSGGGDGGNGGMSASGAVGGNCYDSLYQPALLGSGGGTSYAGSGGNGGGLIQIVASGNVDIEGLVSANGGNAMNDRAGGGSGGGIYIAAASVSGAGTITANGGAGAPGYGGGGGGGRIAIICGANNFSGSMTAYGGGGATYGGAGTIYTQLAGQTGLLLLNNGGNTGTNSTVTLPTLADVIVSGNAGVVPFGSDFFARNVTIGANSLFTSLSSVYLNLSVSNLTVQAGGLFSVNGLGGANTQGGGNTISSSGYTYGGGGGHGGVGGTAGIPTALGGEAYDSPQTPTQLGSVGGGANPATFGGTGGGAILLNVSGTLDIDGAMAANGNNGYGTAGGGGSGGSISLTAGAISGAGAITANGGAGANSLGGGGGGGCIAMIAGINSFAGKVNCYGGAGANPGGAGTVYLQTGGGTPELLLDNDGITGAGPTPVQSVSGENLVIQNGASGIGAGTVDLNNLLVAPNSSLMPQGGSSSGSFVVASNATIQAGGGFIANADGNPANQGSGPGGYSQVTPFSGGGGGNGGMGGNGFTNGATGGHAGYENLAEPLSPGSGGGGLTPYSLGGNGGGSVELTVNGTLQLNGVISANGGNGSGSGGGGGSGGGIYLSAGILSGTGSISANGGAGVNSFGGGGGGGCIAIIANTNTFSGPITAFGGSGTFYGGAGTVYLKTNSFQYAQLTVDNAGQSGAGTVIQSLSSANLTARNGALIAMPAGSFAFFNVLITSNAQLVVTNNDPLIINANNITVQSGCSINANASGYPFNQGPGEGRDLAESPYFPGSGAANAGYGGNAASNSVFGGLPVDGAQNEPITAGSGGGGESPYSIGGSGGGVIELNVLGMLQINGTLSVNAGAGTGTGGGGGSGGSLKLVTGSLSGSGVISANGGSGANSVGGGGGGGMISILLSAQTSLLTNSFNGTISAYGGGGANYGGAGTILIGTNYTEQSTTIVDNGGNIGTNTLITYSSFQNGLILRNGAIGCLNVSGQTFSSLLIASNAWLVPRVVYASGILNLTCEGNVTIQAGGGIIADSYGNPQNDGTGRGFDLVESPSYPCSGGAHGGYGGSSYSNAVLGGVAYDSTTSPDEVGSGGGGYTPYSPGGSGGGYINLVVESPYTTTVNGIISANGGNGSGSGGGGGSGGSIAVNTRTLAGTGSITANGGSGASTIGGGGGGGRIEIFQNQSQIPFSKTNLFSGTITAYGGSGATYGGAGTVYYLTNLLNFFPTVVLDNNGHVGTNTSFAFNNYNVTVQNGAVGLLPSSGSWIANNILILSNSALTVLPTSANITLQPGSLTVAQGGALTLDGDGYISQSGPGSGSSNGGVYGGGGHGGYGGGDSAGSGTAYDSIVSPAYAGSGGTTYQFTPGGAGGGALIINGGALTVNGRLSANGGTSGINAGGGSGGSLNLNRTASLAGSGVISANGGTATGSGGGGGGGRIVVNCLANNFTGQYSAYGGGGNYPGGAGTIYTASYTTPDTASASSLTLLVNNGGIAGTNTPLGTAYALPTTPFELDISGAASVAVLNSLPLLSNLNVSAATTLTMAVAQSNLFIGVLNNANIGGNLNVDQLGYSLANGPGAGSAVNNDGSGGGYGGNGGASSSGAVGGVTYGSAPEPLAFGSGGGNGVATVNGGSSGGGALRLSVLGTLNVTGNLSANGSAGAQDNSGGGSGGSVWITAGALSGTGTILADGGDGALFGGGGGGGGRIAIYTPTNNFTGETNVNGGTGDIFGQAGTIFLGNAFTDFEIISQSPTGQVMNTVISVNLGFNDMVNAASVSPSDFTLITPTGALPSSDLTVAVTGPYSVQVNFPIQNLVGNYTIEAATTISNMLGTPLAVPYSGTFSISLPTISGTITNINGAPVAGVMVQPNGGLTGMMTDANGNYSIGVPNGWSGTVIPSLGTNMFVPGSMSYGDVTASLTNQDYLIVPTVAPNIVSSVSGNNFVLNWTGIPGVSYQVLWSTNLINWLPIGSALAGTSGPMQYFVPSNAAATAYFMIQATH